MEAYKCKEFECVAALYSEDKCFYESGCSECVSGKLCIWCNKFDSCKDAREKLKGQQQEGESIGI